ncbi:NnrS family protein [Marivita sp. GX14005]|uniref:NnrS family protein n=1 Tax=Marivita sp. GX14005 TaxID=2942276 RepID=UPI00201A1354|nr:NnrS family protein [Marivita sp. GX14005]MCL3881073.1 NnrS family protein [Marivita sp. GX14005]
MSTTAELMRAWRGPAILSYGFRPFFFGSAIWALLSMALWIPMLSGAISLPTAFDPVSWHAHEFLYGYLSAVIAGFLLTAVPNWTGRLPIVGWPLGGLFLFWVLGRLIVAASLGLSPLWVALIDLTFNIMLASVLAREIVAGKNWRNLIVLAMLVVFTLGNAVFHWEAAQGAFAAQGYGLRIGLGAAIMMIGVIGGRIVPSFTRNWLVKRGETRLPTPPMRKFDKAALLALLASLLLWTALPYHPVTGAALLAAGALHTVRLARWSGHLTLAEPLVTVLHVGYAFVPLGALAMGGDILLGGSGLAAIQHFWMAGAIGLMTLAVMTRATLGHTGQTLAASPATSAIYIAMLVAVLARVAAGIWPEQSAALHVAAGFGWMGSFALYAAVYGRLLLFKSPAKRAAN